MITPEQERRIGEFWSWFQGRERELAALDDPEDPLWEEALDRLQQVDEGLWFEMPEPGGGERPFVVTADGDTELFELAGAVASRAPALGGWKVVPLNPPAGFDIEVDCEGFRLDASELWFKPAEEGSRPVDLIIGVPGYDEDEGAAVDNGVLDILDTGLGERSAAEDVGEVEVVRLPESPEKQGFRKLSELPGFLERGRKA